jgi:Zn-finger nucleic acid-binding protein
MRTYERNGVHVDQCTECRGIFLDRGELDRLIDAENAWHGGTRPAEKHDDRGHEARHASEHRSEHRSRQDEYSSGGLGAVVGEVLKQVGGQKHGGYQQHGGHKPRKKESFLGDLFG